MMMVVVEWLEPVEAEPFAAVIEAAIATSSFGHPFDLLVPYSSMVGSGHKDNTSGKQIFSLERRKTHHTKIISKR